MLKRKMGWWVLGYAGALAVLLLFLQGIQYRFLVLSHAWEIYSGLLALFFLVLGIFLARKLSRPSPAKIILQVPLPQAEDFVPHANNVTQLGLSKRELEVLAGMARGESNAEIAAALFLSPHTVRSHAARLFEKLEVKRRTQAVEQGRRLGLIP